jgi:hypothetical protein
MPIEYIVNSTKPYPDFIKENEIFKSLNKIDKIFSSIGLSNFKEKVEILNSSGAIVSATQLHNDMCSALQQLNSQCNMKIQTEIASLEKSRNENCFNLQKSIHLTNQLNTVLRNTTTTRLAINENNKLSFKLPVDIFYDHINPIFKKDESIIKVINKIYAFMEKGGILPAAINRIETFNSFKAFSNANMPSKKYDVCFSSHGEDGAWDIATVSMRGINSCQSWTAPQSRGLIGSISSKFVGVIYLESGDSILLPVQGSTMMNSKMMNRCMVRFAISSKTKIPALVMDTMYPSANLDVLNAFKKILKEKSGLNVISAVSDGIGDYYLPEENHNKILKQGEASYMDAHLPIKKVESILLKKDLTALVKKFEADVCIDLGRMLDLKKAPFIEEKAKYEIKLKEYNAAKLEFDNLHKDKTQEERDAIKFELLPPTMTESTFSGGVIGLFKHCDKHHGANSAIRKFSEAIFSSIDLGDVSQFETNEAYYRHYLINFISNKNKIKTASLVKINRGTWMKNFTRSSNKFYNFVFEQIKDYALKSCKELIKKKD